MAYFLLVLSMSAVQALTPSLCPVSSNVKLLRYLPNQCKFSSPVRGITMSSFKFFNRDEERTLLTKIIEKQNPYFWIVLGLPSTGKTALLNNVLDETCQDGAKKYNSLRLNLRGTEVYSRNSLFRALRGSAIRTDNSIWAPFVDTLSKLVRVDLKQIDGIQVQGMDSIEPDSEDQFSSLIDVIPASAGKPCVFVIDEANELRKLAKYDERVR